MSQHREEGFTILELLIAITTASIIIGVLFSLTFNYYANALRAEVTTSMALESQTMLTQLTEDIRLADAIGSTNLIADTNSPVGGWTTNDPSNIIIIESPATDSDRDLIYDDSTGYPYANEFIYFLSGSTMYKRTLKNTAATGNTAVTTCPSATSGCPQDRIFSEKVANLTFTFYDSSNVSTANASLARSVTFTVDMSETVFGKTVSLSNSTRVTLRNQ